MIKAHRQKGYQLMHDGMLALAEVEANGIRINTRRLDATRTSMAIEVKRLRGECQGSKVWGRWRRRFGEKANLGSRDQLSQILYDVMGFPVTSFTETGQKSTEDEALQKMDHPFVRNYSRMMRFEKALTTFLDGIAHEVCDGRLHPVFNLHTVQSYRSSSDSPNFQNYPVRDKEIAEIIRSVFMPTDRDHVLVENDFKGIEVALSASFHQDPNFISYITTSGKDMHRDMAAQIYKLERYLAEWTWKSAKEIRHGAKNMFVFPEFYGDWYKSCAPQLWEWIEKAKLTAPDGRSLYNHLADEGITELGKCSMDEEYEAEPHTFEAHIQRVERDFWENRFGVYGQWKKDYYQKYLKKGYFDIPTGFRIHGTFDRKQCCNYGIQGASFHCLLWSLIQVVDKLRKYNMRSKVVGQIHDSMLGDVHRKELKDYTEIVHEVVAVGLPKQYPWLKVKPEIENEIAVNSWFYKREFKFKAGQFQHPSDPARWTSNPDAFIEALQAMNN